MSRPTPVVTAPLSVRAITALFLGLAVGIMGAPVANGFKVIILIASVTIALLTTFNHPYRRDVRKAVEDTGAKYSTNWAQVLPLFPLWLALMSLPMFPSDWTLAAFAFVIATMYSWALHPQIDGTAHLPRKE